MRPSQARVRRLAKILACAAVLPLLTVGGCPPAEQLPAGAGDGPLGIAGSLAPAVQFELDAYAGSSPLTVLARAFTVSGEPLPDGQYCWTFGDEQDCGPVSTHAERAHTFSNAGVFTVTLSLTLAGAAGPISCTNKDGKPAAQVVVSASPSQPSAPGLPLMPQPTSANQPPVADAGSDSRVVDGDSDGRETVQLDGSRSRDPDGVIAWYQWSDAAGAVVAQGNGASASVALPLGVHRITLTVADDRGVTDVDTVEVTVDPAGALTVTPGTLESIGDEGGPFLPASADYVLTNAGSYEIQWAASNTQPWVTLSKNAGALAPNATDKVTVSINANAGTLGPGDYADTVSFEDLADGSGKTSRTARVKVKGRAAILVVSPDDAFSSVGYQGGPFDPASKVYTLQNVGGQTLNWSASKTQSWMSLSKTAGTLGPNETDTVTARIDASANGLAPGAYADSLSFNNMTSGAGDSVRSASLTVWDRAMLVISGRVADAGGAGISGVVMNGLPGNPTTNGSGDYSGAVNYGWSGTLTPSKAGYTFSPINRTYNNVTSNQAGQNYTGTPSQQQMASQISQYGITWTFDQAYQVGQFVTGDWWVVGPVTVINVNPAPTGSGASYRNGSMIDPIPGNVSAGGDGQAYDGRNAQFNPAKAVSFPMTISPTKSLISTMSLLNFPYTDITGMILVSGQTTSKSGAVLTVVNAPPAPTAFRPPYAGTTKTIYDSAALNIAGLPALAPVAGTPSIATYATYFQRPWIDHLTNWMGRLMHPADNMPNYGRELAMYVGGGGLLATLDFSVDQKRPLVLGLTQVGIDYYHISLLAPNLWEVIAGQNFGRKFPILFAGHMLENSEMLNHPATGWSEDTSTYYGTDVTPNQTLWTGWAGGAEPPWTFPNPPGSANVLYNYMAGLDNQGRLWHHEFVAPAGWDDSPFPSNGNQYPWDKHEGYRRMSMPALPGQALAARILGLKAAWGHDAYFDYVDRWVYEDDAPLRQAIAAAAVAAGNWNILAPYPGRDWTNPNSYTPFGGEFLSAFAGNMWTAYRPSH